MATVNAVLVKSRKDKQGRCTIKLAVQHENKKKLLSLLGGTFKATEDEWDDEQRLIKFKTSNAKQINALNTEILMQKQNILEIIEQYEKSRVPWSLSMLADRLDKKPTTASFAEMAEKYIKKVAEQNEETGRLYQKTLQTFSKYCGERFNRLTCSDIDYKFVSDYHDYQQGKGLTDATIKTRMTFLKSILGMAIREKVASPETFPFSKKEDGRYYDFKKLNVKPRHRSLPESYLEQLLAYRAYDNHDIHWQIHLFNAEHIYLEYRAIIHLKHSDIKYYVDENGTKRNGFRVYSRRHRQYVTVFITPLMMRIITDVKANYKTYNDYVFPILKKDIQDEREWKHIKSVHAHAVHWCKERIPLQWKTGKKYTDEELKEFANYRFYNYGKKLALLLWRFSFSMDGINMLDMLKLKTSNIETMLDRDGNLVRVLCWVRSKTRVKIETSLTQDAELIIEFFEKFRHQFPCADGYLLPILSQEDADNSDKQKWYKRRNSILATVNRCMKKIAREIGWPEEVAEKLSFYWGRHSFAQRALLSGANMERIQSHLGHLNVQSTHNYVSGFDVLNKHDFKQSIFAKDRPAI